MRLHAAALYLEPRGEEAVCDIWRGLAREGITTSLLGIQGARPHLTLSIYNDLDTEAFEQCFADFARSLKPIHLDLSTIGVFPNASPVVFLTPVVTSDLLELHKSFHQFAAQFKDQAVEHYLPGHWVPHCSLGIGLKPDIVSAAVRYCLQQVKLPIHTFIAEIGLLEMEMQDRKVLAGCEVQRFALETGHMLPNRGCPKADNFISC